MTTPHRTLQMALDALDAITDDVDGTGLNTMPSFDKALDAIAALREALNAPEPEPYGHVTTHTVTGQQFFYRYPSPPYLDTAKECIAVYAAPPAAPDHLRDIAEKVAPAAPLPDGMETNADEVICPNCAHQFRAIPENVQSLLLASGHEPPFTASPAAPVPLTDDRLHTFLNAAASEGLVLDGVDAADLYIATFPERYAAVVASIEGHGIAASPEQPK